MREPAAVTVVPAAELSEPGADVTQVRLRKIEFDVVIVVIPNGVPVDGQRSFFANIMLVM